MHRPALLALMMLALLPNAALGRTTAAADEAYQSAKDGWQALKTDAKKRAFRHHWLNVARKFEKVVSKYADTDRGPEAVYMLGELYEGLHRYSRRAEDLAQAESAWRKLVETWPAHRLSDDAAVSLAKLLKDRKGGAADAREALTAVRPHANDMKQEIDALLAELPKPAPARAKARGKAVAARDEEAPARAAEAPKTAAAGTAHQGDDASDAEATADAPDDTTERLLGAIRKLGRDARQVDATVARATRGRPEAQVAARRVALSRPGTEATDDEPGAVAALSERLRDVRLPGSGPEAAEAKTRLKAMARLNRDAELSLAQQLGLKVRRVVIDPGHGGHDTGAIGPGGTTEAAVALGISLKLKKALEAQGLEVLLTRDDDTFVKLEQRSRFANTHDGDLFISIHCNAAPSKKLRGIETYTLNTSSNRYSVRLAARENASSQKGLGDLRYILADLATKANTTESRRLADRVQTGLTTSLSRKYSGVRSLGTKEALFFVLLGTRMPAILVETSFISNPEDETRLKGDAYQQDIADSIAASVQGFLDERLQVAQLD